MSTPELLVRPADDANAELVALVHPPDWQNPRAARSYDLIVVGGGTAGLVAAVGAAGLGAKVALIERHLLGGDCLNTGCVPSKAIIRSSRVLGEWRRAPGLGVLGGEPVVDFGTVMQRMRFRRRGIAKHDSAKRLASLGIDVFFGSARFVDHRTLNVDDQQLRFGRALIATGGRAVAPPIPGLDTIAFLTNETLFSLTELPPRLAIIGAGPIGCEMAQTFARFGSEVTVFDQGSQILTRDGADAARLVRNQLEAEGVRFELGARIERVGQTGADVRVYYVRNGGNAITAGNVAADALLVAAGRAPNIEDLDCHAAGIATDEDGVVVNDRLQTTNRRVFASGDVCSRFKFTHAADAMSRIVIQNALFFGRRKASALVIPWVTYTDPELAQVGITDADVASSLGRYATVTVPLSDVDRAVVDDDTDGFVRVHHERGRVRGCTIVAPHAGEMIGEAVYVITHSGTLADLSATIHPYPTVAEALRKAGDAYRRQALTPFVRRLLTYYFGWTR
jgi:pyruvate/2-oxoglutarate dehydrogenase complex dihydrolipoamide dehydrogenase (E3) component